MSYMIMNNITNVSPPSIQVEETPLTPEEAAWDRAYRKKTVGAVERHSIFVPHAKLEKSSIILGKLCRWRLPRYVSLKILHLLFKVGNSSLKCGHILYPQVMYGKSRREMDSSISSTNDRGMARRGES
jgi:hypothetical protein